MHLIPLSQPYPCHIHPIPRPTLRTVLSHTPLAPPPQTTTPKPGTHRLQLCKKQPSLPTPNPILNDTTQTPQHNPLIFPLVPFRKLPLLAPIRNQLRQPRLRSQVCRLARTRPVPDPRDAVVRRAHKVPRRPREQFLEEGAGAAHAGFGGGRAGRVVEAEGVAPDFEDLVAEVDGAALVAWEIAAAG